jgi:hypothetical protein
VGAITFDFDERARVFRFTFDGGPERAMPILEGDELGRWNRRYAALYLGFLDKSEQAEKAGDVPAVVHAIVNANNEVIEDGVDALIVFDRTGALGGRDWIREHLDPSQLVLMLQRIARAQA